MSPSLKTLAGKNDAKPALVPKLRFLEFRGAEVWESGKVDDLVDTVTPPKKLPTALYASSGAFPIIDQSQSDICGWTDDIEALIQEPLPLIVFGDHTCILKLIAKPFAQGADGIKILKTGPKLGTPYLYQFLSYQPVTTEEYKRHYAILKEKIIYFPEFKSGEQQKIAECLSSVDELLAAQARKVDALKTHKKGLMQQLFPREGETQPRLRFPEFQNAGEWESKTLGAVCELYQPVTLSSSELSMTGEHFVYGANGVIGTHNEYNHEDSEIAVTCRGATCGEVTVTMPQSWITGNAMVVKPRSKNLRRDFIFQYFKNHGLKTVISGSAQPQITRTGFAPLVIFFPTFEEQERIAECLSSLDAVITAETQKLETLKAHKRGLMQQLFPSPEETADL